MSSPFAGSDPRAASADDEVDAVADEPQADEQAAHDDALIGMRVDPGPEPAQQRLEREAAAMLARE